MQAWRLKILHGLILALFIGVVIRLGYWQLVNRDQLQAQAEDQRTASTKIMGDRGSILFSDGTTVVGNELSYLVFADKTQIKNTDIDPIANALSSIVQVPAASLSAKLSQNLSWIPLVQKVTPDTKKAIAALNLPGIGFDQHQQRYYPEASMAADLLGFVGKDDSGQDQGYFGLEGYYDDTLRGKEGFETLQTDVFGRPILTAQSVEAAAEPGSTLVLNIDRTVQYIAEQKLKEGLDEFHAQSGDVTIMDPYTGAILAMASFPSYNPATYYDASASAYKNPVVSDTYEPGSTFKTIMMAAAIDTGAITANSICPCTNEPRNIDGSVIHNWDDTYRQNESMGDILKNSDNNAMTWVGDQMGHDTIINYLQKFGFGKPTDIDLQDEEAQPLRDKKDWYPIDYATATFGQGVAVTPIQLVRAEAALANGGKLMEPHVVKQIVTNGKTIDIKPKVIQQVISPQTAQTMTNLLEYTVDNSEAKRLYKPAGFRMAGKTGTAQIPIAGHYDDMSKVYASYIGFGPLEHPRFVMLVRYDQPVGGEHGALTAEPIFYEIAKQLFEYWGITPTEPQ